MRPHTVIAAMLAAVTAGCVHLPDSATALSPTTLERRQVETRRFEGIAEERLLAACAGVLQDLGFNVETSDSQLGLITASKERDAKDMSQLAGAILLAVLTGVTVPIDRDQTIRATVVVFPAAGGKKDSHLVRISLQRTVRTTSAGFARSEWLKDPALYQGFFEKLSQAVFLEAHKL